MLNPNAAARAGAILAQRRFQERIQTATNNIFYSIKNNNQLEIAKVKDKSGKEIDLEIYIASKFETLDSEEFFGGAPQIKPEDAEILMKEIDDDERNSIMKRYHAFIQPLNWKPYRDSLKTLGYLSLLSKEDIYNATKFSLVPRGLDANATMAYSITRSLDSLAEGIEKNSKEISEKIYCDSDMLQGIAKKIRSASLNRIYFEFKTIKNKLSERYSLGIEKALKDVKEYGNLRRSNNTQITYF